MTHTYTTCAGEDMWHVYNLIRKGDHVTTSTFRKITRDSGAGSSSDRVRVKLTVQVEDVDFDPEGMNAQLSAHQSFTVPSSALSLEALRKHDEDL